MKQILSLPHDPLPVAPCEGAVVDGRHVLLRWEAAETADRYCVQIASGSDFREVLFEQEVPGGTTALVVRRHFPDDDQTFYWRALAGNAEGWSAGDHVEAFTSGTAGQVGRFVVPDVSEPFGPVAALFSFGALEALTEVLPSHQFRSGGAVGDEHPESVEAAEVFGIELGLLIAVAVLVGAALFILFSAC